MEPAGNAASPVAVERYNPNSIPEAVQTVGWAKKS
jgi:hypothetical protein